MRAKISEIFKSVQGEGVYQGIPQVFVRFWGCDIGCIFCDTRPVTYNEIAVDDIISSIEQYKEYHSVSITGGEPLEQVRALKDLTHCLREKNIKVYLETNGILYKDLVKVIDYIDIIAMDFKLPSSTGLGSFWSEHKRFLEISLAREVFVKAVIGEKTTVSDIHSSIDIIKEIKPGLSFVLQPQNPLEDILEGKLNFFKNICIDNKINVRIIPQLHKQLGIK